MEKHGFEFKKKFVLEYLDIKGRTSYFSKKIWTRKKTLNKPKIDTKA
ncbi:hypothetical protein [Lachnoanaerobaculum gingivalis]|jgi:hypothetical protein|nr:hypothetical protein [Lachnoanaerobaculum gingivalis]